MPLYAVYVSGVALTKISTQFMVCPTYKDLAIYYAQQFQNACETHLNSLNIIDSADAIDANSAANQLAGALGVKELASQRHQWRIYMMIYITEKLYLTKHLVLKAILIIIMTKDIVVLTIIMMKDIVCRLVQLYLIRTYIVHHLNTVNGNVQDMLILNCMMPMVKLE